MAVQEQYREANDRIHAPEDLIRRTAVSVWYASASGISL